MRSPKPVLVLVHGWGMNARVFDPLADRLAEHFDVRGFDLPGHGGRAAQAVNTLEAWADALAGALPDDANLLGWSLGGQVALRAALDHPGKVARLILVATTPRFVRDGDWASAMDAADLATFGEALLADPVATLQRFLSLQTRGTPGQKALLQRLRQALAEAPEPDPTALAAGLAILRETDLRDDATRLTQPTLVLHGALDTLTPAAAGAWLARNLRAAHHVEFERAAHAPHLSHPDEVAREIERFCL